MDWIVCNKCGSPPNVKKLLITSCYHIACESCLVPNDTCCICSKSTKCLLIGPKMPPQVIKLFRDPKDIAADIFRRLEKTLAFQKFHKEKANSAQKKKHTQRRETLKKYMINAKNIKGNFQKAKKAKEEMTEKLKENEEKIKKLEEKIQEQENFILKMSQSLEKPISSTFTSFKSSTPKNPKKTSSLETADKFGIELSPIGKETLELPKTPSLSSFTSTTSSVPSFKNQDNRDNFDMNFDGLSRQSSTSSVASNNSFQSQNSSLF